MTNRLPWKSLLVLTACTAAAAVRPAFADGPRTFLVTPAKPSEACVDEIDNAVKAVMQANGVYGASLAIVKDTKLVYAKGYTWAPAGGQVIQPTTLFRQASVSKLFTSIAIYQLMQEGKLSLDLPMENILGATGVNGHPPPPAFQNITLGNLLEMDAGIDPNLPWEDVAATQYFGAKLPATHQQLAGYASASSLLCKPGDKSQAYYNNGDFMLLGQVVAKARGADTFIRAIGGPLLNPLHITRIREARSLEDEQFADEAHYYSNPPAKKYSVMSPDQPIVNEGYGETNFENLGGAGGLSGAATDVARVLAALSIRENNPMLQEKWIRDMLSRAAYDYTDHGYSHIASNGKSDAFGFFGTDYVKEEDKAKGDYYGFKGGYLSTSQNGIYFERGGLSYVVCWNGLTPNGEAWYPAFHSVLDAAGSHDWGSTDLFPKYGMPSFGASGHLTAIQRGARLAMPTRPLSSISRSQLIIRNLRLK